MEKGPSGEQLGEVRDREAEVLEEPVVETAAETREITLNLNRDEQLVLHAALNEYRIQVQRQLEEAQKRISEGGQESYKNEIGDKNVHLDRTMSVVNKVYEQTKDI